MPTCTLFGEDEQAFQKLRSGFRADVARPCPQSIPRWRDAGLVEPLPVDKALCERMIGEFERIKAGF